MIHLGECIWWIYSFLKLSSYSRNFVRPDTMFMLVRRGTDHVEVAAVPVPSELMSQFRDVIIGADIMFVNKLPFDHITQHQVWHGCAYLQSEAGESRQSRPRCPKHL